MKLRKAQAGMLLIEVLVTIVIVSFGLLGVAGVILNSLKVNESSYTRAQAVWLANDIIDRMRANRGAAEGATLPYNVALGSACLLTDPTPVPGKDVNQWLCTIANTLPTGQGSVNLVAATKKVAVIVQWDDSRATGGSSAQQFLVETRL